MSELYLSRLRVWAPGISAAGEWDEWAHGKREIIHDSKGPDLSFTEPIFRRRLSQISKMTIQVVHDLLPLEEETKLFFISLRGELARQLQIDKMIIEEKSLMPASFSLSVFNAPVALASIALGLKGGYTAIYPAGSNAFNYGLVAAEAEIMAEILCGKNQDIAFVYSDEQVPVEYEPFFGEPPYPAAFGFILSAESANQSIPLSSVKEPDISPLGFLKKILLCKDIHSHPFV